MERAFSWIVGAVGLAMQFVAEVLFAAALLFLLLVIW
jgi:hypothetical protein